MPLQDITAQCNLATASSASTGKEQKRDVSTVKHDSPRKLDAPQACLNSDASFPTDGGSPPSFASYSKAPFLVSTVVPEQAEAFEFPTSSGCHPCYTEGMGIDMTPFDDWNTTLLCQPIRLSSEYFQPSDCGDKRSICLLCRGVSVQAGSEFRHCRGRAHRTAYSLLQTLRFTEASERAFIQQQCIVKNDIVMTAWRCTICDTKTLSHEYMNKHLLGKKHRMLANEVESWAAPTGNVDEYNIGSFDSAKGDSINSCFYCQTGQVHYDCLQGNPLDGMSQDVDDALVGYEDNASIRSPDDIVRFLGLLSPEKSVKPLSEARSRSMLYQDESVHKLNDYSTLCVFSPLIGHRGNSIETMDNAYHSSFTNNCATFGHPDPFDVAAHGLTTKYSYDGSSLWSSLDKQVPRFGSDSLCMGISDTNQGYAW
ncbi:hypothetical protein MPSEU_001059400 [Mayamaea pseudoterrestris]|nr:hypothetical protein MPSEU_001059400 [Mayamaea pseudoterrestris]